MAWGCFVTALHLLYCTVMCVHFSYQLWVFICCLSSGYLELNRTSVLSPKALGLSRDEFVFISDYYYVFSKGLFLFQD